MPPFLQFGLRAYTKKAKILRAREISDPSFKLQSAYAVYFLYATSLFAKVHTMYT